MKPLGVLIVSVFLILESFAGILTGLGMIVAKEEFYGVMKEEFKRILSDLNATNVVDAEGIFDKVYELTSYAVIILGVLYLIVAIGVFTLKNWARIFTIIFLVFQLFYSLVTVYANPLSLLGVAISAGLIFYLLKRDVKEKFLGKQMTIEERVLGRKI